MLRIDPVKQKIDSKADPDTLCPQLSRSLQNITILQKGSDDIISNGYPLPASLLPKGKDDEKEGKEILKNTVQGGLKRCGGQGDILSGSVGVLLAWGAEWVKGTYEYAKCILFTLHKSLARTDLTTSRIC